MPVRRITAVQTHPLRSLVLRPGQPLSACRWEGDDDPDSLHLGSFVDDELVAIASAIRISMPCDVPADLDFTNAYRLRGMATHPDCRGQGHGRALLRACLEEVRERGVDVLWCFARTSAVDFYLRNGLVVAGNELELPGIGPHVVMWCATK